MREVRTGVWHWEAPHPDWKPDPDRGELVSSQAIDDGERLWLFDPLAPPSEVDELAGGRETAIVLTCPWHRPDAPPRALDREPPALVGSDTLIRGSGLEFPADWDSSRA